MRKKKGKFHITKGEVEKENPSLLAPTQNVEENFARGEGSVVPDPSDIPGGLDSTLTQHFTPRPDMEGAAEEAVLESSEGKPTEKKEKRKKTK